MDPDQNPLLDPNQYNLPTKHSKSVQPLSEKINNTEQKTGAGEAVSLIRGKLDKIYSTEPNANEELAEAKVAGKHRSKHQKYMYELSTSGKSLAEIQTAWHNYYKALPNDEKHQVWQEFYAEHSRITTETQKPQAQSTPHNPPHHAPHHQVRQHTEPRTIDTIKSELLKRVGMRSTGSRGKASHSLFFGLAMGSIVAGFMMFGFFNERFIAPFITPSKSVSNTPIVIDPSTTAVGPESKVIIPKINVEIPVIFNEESTSENAIQKALEEGVVHYSTTSNPGELGNGAIFGHSSNNILNKGKFKFAFVLLKRMEEGDTFYVQKDGKRYAYRVYKKTVVSPDQVGVLGVQEKPATMTLITCDPPGTSINRLVVVGEQISPDPGTNVASSAKTDATNPAILPSNSPSLWSRFVGWLSS